MLWLGSILEVDVQSLRATVSNNDGRSEDALLQCVSLSDNNPGSYYIPKIGDTCIVISNDEIHLIVGYLPHDWSTKYNPPKGLIVSKEADNDLTSMVP